MSDVGEGDPSSRQNVYGRRLQRRHAPQLCTRRSGTIRGFEVGEVRHIGENEPEVRVAPLNRQDRSPRRRSADEPHVDIRQRASVLERQRLARRRVRYQSDDPPRGGQRRRLTAARRGEQRADQETSGLRRSPRSSRSGHCTNTLQGGFCHNGPGPHRRGATRCDKKPLAKVL